MATKAQIVAAILEVAGNPESGPIFEYAEKWADAIVGLDTVTSEVAYAGPAKETRITKPEETR